MDWYKLTIYIATDEDLEHMVGDPFALARVLRQGRYFIDGDRNAVDYNVSAADSNTRVVGVGGP